MILEFSSGPSWIVTESKLQLAWFSSWKVNMSGSKYLHLRGHKGTLTAMKSLKKVNYNVSSFLVLKPEVECFIKTSIQKRAKTLLLKEKNFLQIRSKQKK
jgi:hypothetical protein